MLEYARRRLEELGAVLKGAAEGVQSFLYFLFVPPADVDADELDAIAMMADEFDNFE